MFQVGQHVKVKRTDGRVQDGWKVAQVGSPYQAPEIRPIRVEYDLATPAKPRRCLWKYVSATDLARWNGRL